MILPDINLLIHAYDAESPQHHAAREWWDGVLAGGEGVGIAWPVMLGFVRIATHRRILNNPMSPDIVCGIVEEWFSLPHVHVINPAEGHFTRLRERLEALGTAGNLTTDAHLATLAMERGYVLHSTDTDFARFDGLSWRNPIRPAQ
jgi:toxin-antitoxin system PIN domain toxin